MRGILYGVGVGPGDPELLTLKAARIIRECAVVAVPDSGAGGQVALDIARAHIGDREVLRLYLPMTRDKAELDRCRDQAAAEICRQLDAGWSVAFLTLGDPTVYSTYSYLHERVAGRGYEARMVPGVPSFCAAAAALGAPLCEAGQPLHIAPASYAYPERVLALPGTRVLMKSGKKMVRVLALLRDRGLLGSAMLAEQVGMAGERLERNLTGRTEAGYFSVVIVKEDGEGE